MENAGYQVADFVRRFHPGSRVAVYAGVGNNGGDAVAAARRLHGWGFDVEVVPASREMEGPPAEEMRILESLDVPVVDGPVEGPDLVVDGLIGYGLDGEPRPPFDRLIREVNDHGAETVSIDVPSGVDADTGEAVEPHVEADSTVTLGLPKTGLEGCGSAGEVWLADIGIPSQVYREVGVSGPKMFLESSLTRVQ